MRLQPATTRIAAIPQQIPAFRFNPSVPSRQECTGRNALRTGIRVSVSSAATLPIVAMNVPSSETTANEVKTVTPEPNSQKNTAVATPMSNSNDRVIGVELQYWFCALKALSGGWRLCVLIWFGFGALLFHRPPSDLRWHGFAAAHPAAKP